MKTLTAETAKKLHTQLAKINRAIHNICMGGCGAFAALLAETMISYGYNAQVIEVTPQEPDLWQQLMGLDADYFVSHYKQNNKALHDLVVNNGFPDHDKLQLCSHYVVKINDYYFDSTGYSTQTNNTITWSGYTFIIVGEVPLKDIEYVSLENRGNVWNTQYNPANNSKLKDMLISNLSFLNN